MRGLLQCFFSLCQVRGRKLLLGSHNLFNPGFDFLKLAVVGIWYRAGNNEWSAGFVNKHTINLIDDCKIEITLHHLLNSACHIVAQIIKAEFVVRSVGDITLVLLASFFRSHGIENNAN